ncbi:hypothetical protein C8R44DRAFT_623906 [Mycena epipterygia]|nr:hypothetical protein C8R44DRAFT_623906 [Mycena epipterygia]
MYELENTYRSLAKLTEAEQLQVAVVEKRKTVLGEDHPDTLTAMHDLASTYHVLGMLEEAEKLQVAVVEKRKNILGEDHPDTLIALNSLASTYYALGKFQEAEKLQVVALEKRRTGYPDPKEKKDLPATTDLPEYLDPKEKGNPGATTVSPEYIVSRWKEAALLLLPSHFSTPNLLTTSLPSNFLSNIAHFTVARSLEDSRSDSDYECVQIEVKEEWQRALTLVRDLCG